jgi:2-polyprenyl-6-methoxyphenol hydroxylase-like FAD-dependent oxidoreductase
MSEILPLRITVAGGSIGGLCAGIQLKDIVAEVEIFERHPGSMEARGAGIVVQSELTDLLRQHNAPELPTTSCSIRRYLDPDSGNEQVQYMPQRFTSWEAIYKTLRAAFPETLYHMGMPLIDFKQRNRQVSVTIAGRDPFDVDMLICADGANSESRRRLLPEVGPRYAGYIAWRGTLDEADVPSHLVSFFDDAFTFSEARSGGHILTYMILGENADPRPGSRRLNWVWYVQARLDDLNCLLVDRYGRRHHTSLPRGLAPDETVRALHDIAKREVHPKMAELVEATTDPFLQTIVDIIVPQTVFGRVMLLGEAAFVIRPPTAAATAKAAYDATMLSIALRDAKKNVDEGLRKAEKAQLQYGQRLVEYGVSLGRRSVP